MRRLSAVLVLQLALIGISGAGARADAPACGDVVTADVTLTSSLTGCADGLVVAADGVTVDLGGHAIEGTGRGTGVSVAGHSGVTVRNGAVRGFATGVRLEAASDALVTELDVRDASGAGILAEGGEDVHVLHTTVMRAAAGISVRGLPTPVARAVIEHNVVARNRFVGIELVFAPATSVSRNVAIANGRAGFSLIRSNVDSFARNVANRNAGFGVMSSDSHGRYVDNVANANAGDGLHIADTIPDHGRFFTLARNRANANAGLGIRAFPGVIDGGGNRARANGDPAQCRDIVCNAP